MIGQSAPVVYDLEVTPDTSVTLSDPSRKRPRLEEEVVASSPPLNPTGGSFNPGGASVISGSYSVGEPNEGLAVFKDVIDEGEMSSIWDARWRVDRFIDNRLTSEVDRAKYKEISTRAGCRVLEHLSLRCAFLARSVELDVIEQKRTLEEVIAERDRGAERVRELGEKVKELETSMGTLKKSEDDLKKSVGVLTAEKTELATDLQKERDLNAAELAKWTEKEAKLVADVESYKDDAAAQFEAGFEKAVEQVRALFPNLDVTEMSMFKIVRDGRLTDMTEPGANAEDA